MGTENTHLSDATLRALHKPKWNRWALSLRVLAGVLLVGGLFAQYDFFEIIRRLTELDAAYAFAALALIAGQYLLGFVRWQYILHRHDVWLSLRRSFSIFGIGALANLVLVTSLAGVSVRGLMLAEENVELSRIVGVLLVERIAALGGMVLCVLLGLAISHRLLMGQFTSDAGFGVNFWLPAIGVLSAILVLALLWRLQSVKVMVAQIRKSFLSVKVIGLLVVASSAIILLGFAGVALLAAGMDIAIDPIFFVTAMPVVAFVASLPITMGGWGVREGMMVAGLGLFGVKAEPALALSVAYGFAGILVACAFGLIALIWYMAIWRNRKPAASSSDAG